MRKNKRKYFILFSLFIFSCQQNNQNVQKEHSLNCSDESIKFKKEQLFMFNLKQDSVIIGEQGTVLSFSNDRGTKTKDSIQIILEEYYSITDFILNGLETKTSQGELIETLGMIRVGLVDDKNLFKLNMPFEINFLYTKDDFLLFVGDYNADSSVAWVPTNKNYILKTTSYNDKGELIEERTEIIYSFFTDNFGWFNYDKFVDINEKIDLFVNVEDMNPEIQYSLVFYSINSIINGQRNNKKNQIEFKGIPSNEKVSMIGLKVKEDKLYFNILDLTTDTKNASFPKLLPISQSEFKHIIDEKFGINLINRPQPRF